MELKTTVKDLGRMPWFYRANSRTGKIFGKKSLHLDEETEMVIDYMHYPKGFTTVLHRHPASHGIYVLEDSWRRTVSFTDQERLSGIRRESQPHMERQNMRT